MKKKNRQGKDLRNVLFLTCTLAVAVMVYWISLTRKPSGQAAISSPVQQTVSTKAQPPVPPYYASANAAKPYPKLIPAAYYRRYPLVERAYEDAAQIPGVLAQQPCYCYCDKVGHRSLLDCYASDHAARCLICIKEALLAWQMTQCPNTPAEIRQAIVRGEWRSVDVRAASR